MRFVTVLSVFHWFVKKQTLHFENFYGFGFFSDGELSELLIFDEVKTLQMIIKNRLTYNCFR